MASLSPKEVELVQTVLSNVEGGEAAFCKLVDFENVYPVTGHKDASIARTMFRRLLQKLNGGKEKAATSPKTPKSAKPQGVTKTKAPGAKGGRGRKKKVVEDVFVSGDEGANDAGNEENGGEESALTKEDLEGAEGGVKE